jgi:hypothetical protein
MRLLSAKRFCVSALLSENNADGTMGPGYRVSGGHPARVFDREALIYFQILQATKRNDPLL